MLRYLFFEGCSWLAFHWFVQLICVLAVTFDASFKMYISFEDDVHLQKWKLKTHGHHFTTFVLIFFKFQVKFNWDHKILFSYAK